MTPTPAWSLAADAELHALLAEHDGLRGSLRALRRAYLSWIATGRDAKS